MDVLRLTILPVFLGWSPGVSGDPPDPVGTPSLEKSVSKREKMRNFTTQSSLSDEKCKQVNLARMRGRSKEIPASVSQVTCI